MTYFSKVKFISTLLLTGTSNQMAINGISQPLGTANDRETVNVNVGGGGFQPDMSTSERG